MVNTVNTEETREAIKKAVNRIIDVLYKDYWWRDSVSIEVNSQIDNQTEISQVTIGSEFFISIGDVLMAHMSNEPSLLNSEFLLDSNKFTFTFNCMNGKSLIGPLEEKLNHDFVVVEQIENQSSLVPANSEVLDDIEYFKKMIRKIVDAQFKCMLWCEQVSIGANIKENNVIIDIRSDFFYIIGNTLLRHIGIDNLLLMDHRFLHDSNTFTFTLNNKSNEDVKTFLENKVRDISNRALSENELAMLQTKKIHYKPSKRIWLFKDQGRVIPPLFSASITLLIVTIMAGTGGIAVPFSVVALLGVLTVLSVSGLAVSVDDKVKKHRAETATEEYKSPCQMKAG